MGGYAPTLLYGRAVAPTSGSYAITGNASSGILVDVVPSLVTTDKAFVYYDAKSTGTTLTFGTTATSGNLLVLFVTTNAGDATYSPVINTPSGWTQVLQGSNLNSVAPFTTWPDSCVGAVFTKISNGTETNVMLTGTNAFTWAVACLQYTPAGISVIANSRMNGDGTSTASTSIVMPSVNVTQPNSLILAGGFTVNVSRYGGGWDSSIAGSLVTTVGNSAGDGNGGDNTANDPFMFIYALTQTGTGNTGNQTIYNGTGGSYGNNFSLGTQIVISGSKTY